MKDHRRSIRGYLVVKPKPQSPRTLTPHPPIPETMNLSLKHSLMTFASSAVELG